VPQQLGHPPAGAGGNGGTHPGPLSLSSEQLPLIAEGAEVGGDVVCGISRRFHQARMPQPGQRPATAFRRTASNATMA